MVQKIPSNSKEKLHERSRTQKAITVCGIVASVLFMVLIGRLAVLQIRDHDKYTSLALNQQISSTEVLAKRGTIYDSTHKTLAVSSEAYNIFISPAEMIKYGEDGDKIATDLAAMLNVDRNEILKAEQNEESWYEIIARKVDRDKEEEVQSYIDENSLKSVHIESVQQREYPYNELACHVIGFVGDEGTGLSGIEYYYDDALTGTAGKTQELTTASGEVLAYLESGTDSSQGYNVVSTIDATIQYYLEKNLEQAVSDYKVQNGAGAIVMDVNTGAILGMASLGNFNLNDYLTISEEDQAKVDAAESEEEANALEKEARENMWRNKCIQDTYEPGSTFKILTLSMALQQGVVSDSDNFYCGGSLQVLGDTEPRNCWSDGHGNQNLTEAVMHSCNVAFMQIGLKIGAESFYKYCDAFGLLNLTGDDSEAPSASTGIDLAGESSSIWWSPEVFCDPNNQSQLAAASFGQTFNITPLQLITSVCACVNGGYLMEPYVVSQITDSDGKVVYSHSNDPLRQVISSSVSKKVCSILEQVVSNKEEGTGTNAYIAGYRIGGKNRNL
jgi:stage V sporulation protein D (sporulation-specific penicillin-binding protein)